LMYRPGRLPERLYRPERLLGPNWVRTADLQNLDVAYIYFGRPRIHVQNYGEVESESFKIF